MGAAAVYDLTVVYEPFNIPRGNTFAALMCGTFPKQVKIFLLFPSLHMRFSRPVLHPHHPHSNVLSPSRRKAPREVPHTVTPFYLQWSPLLSAGATNDLLSRTSPSHLLWSARPFPPQYNTHPFILNRPFRARTRRKYLINSPRTGSSCSGPASLCISYSRSFFCMYSLDQ